jgi:cystathionine gamma-synthase
MPVDLLKNPRCETQHLGLSLPDDPHAVSACLPTWAHNIGYEEGDPAVISRLKSAYPRFCLHPLVRELCDRFLNTDTRTGLPFASARCARRAVDYLKWHGIQTAELIDLPGMEGCGVSVLSSDFSRLKQYWQHAGEIVSSRVAEQVLQGQTPLCSETADRSEVRQRVADLHDVDQRDVFLFPSGMAAIAAAWRAAQQLHPAGRSYQFGFPYVDTLKIQERFPDSEYSFLPLGDQQQLQQLKSECGEKAVSAIFCEVPTNPLLKVPDIAGLRSIADQTQSVLVIDDTLTACGNLQVLPWSDIVVTSLTKYFSGQGNVLAGALVLNPDGPQYQAIRAIIEGDFEETLNDQDVRVLNSNSTDLSQRMQAINSNAVVLAERLAEHPAVDSVFYPRSESQADGCGPKWQEGCFGGLLSVVLKNPEQWTPQVFDALQVCKGPNLGTYFTLCCPYTILAHYDELDFVESCGVSRWLLRISVGTEPIEDLWSRIDQALATVSNSPAGQASV